MRALFSGRWTDNWLLDIVVGGLKESNKGFPKEQVEVIYDETDDSFRAAQLAVARHRVDIWPLDEVDTFPQMVFVLHDSLPYDQEQLKCIDRYLAQGVPVIHLRHLDRETVRRLRAPKKSAVAGRKLPAKRVAKRRSKG